MTKLTYTWPRNSICLRPAPLEVDSLAEEIYYRVCRTDFRTPGFCIVNAGRTIDSQTLRRWMALIKDGMAGIHEERTGKTLAYHSATRSDRHATRPVVETVPAESFLLLGYEPSAIDAAIEIADYARAAHDLGLSPQEFLARHNPLLREGQEILRPYASRLPCFSKTDYQIICINNSSATYSPEQFHWQGVWHTVADAATDSSQPRVINSMVITSVSAGLQDRVTPGEVTEFLTMDAISARR